MTEIKIQKSSRSLQKHYKSQNEEDDFGKRNVEVTTTQCQMKSLGLNSLQYQASSEYEKNTNNLFDLWDMFFLNENDAKEGYQKREVLPGAIVNLNDDLIICEDEKKFQEYFLVQKEKFVQKKEGKMDKDSEMSLNKERIEQHQEEIIEQEESVPAYQTENPKESKAEKNTKKNTGQKRMQAKAEKNNKENTGQKLIFKSSPFSKNPLRSSFSGWFKSGKIPLGLKGGSDREAKGKRRKKLGLSCAKLKV